MNAHDFVYARVVDGLRLAATDFQVQTEVLPGFVHLPDEIVNAVEPVYFDQLLVHGLISQRQLEALREFGQYLDTAEAYENYDEAVAALEDGKWFEELRARARATLRQLGEEVVRPTLEGVKYVPGG